MRSSDYIKLAERLKEASESNYIRVNISSNPDEPLGWSVRIGDKEGSEQAESIDEIIEETFKLVNDSSGRTEEKA